MEFEVLVFLKKKRKPRKRFSFVIGVQRFSFVIGIQHFSFVSRPPAQS